MTKEEILAELAATAPTFCRMESSPAELDLKTQDQQLRAKNPTRG